MPNILNNINQLLINEFKETINYCFNNGLFFLRASGHKVEIDIIKPSQCKRRSLAGNNLQEFLIDENPNWKNFPRRSYSLMGAVTRISALNRLENIIDASEYLTEYGRNYYIVFPKILFNSNLAISSADDFICSVLPYKHLTLYDLYTTVISLFANTQIINEYDESYQFKNLEEFKEMCLKLTNHIKYYEENSINIAKKEYYIYGTLALMFNMQPDQLIRKIIDKSFINVLWENLSPFSKNLSNYNVLIKNESDINNLISLNSKVNEFWTEEDCLVVNLNNYNEILKINN